MGLDLHVVVAGEIVFSFTYIAAHNRDPTVIRAAGFLSLLLLAALPGSP